MESVIKCNVCFENYDAAEHTPRLLPCGHSICGSCLVGILNNPILKKCPFDNLALNSSQNSLASFPINVLVMEMLGTKSDNLCKAHLGEKLKYICLTENKRICSECAKQDEHKEHNIKKIKTLKAQGAKAKGDLQQSLLNIRDYEQEKAQEFEQRKKVFIKTIDDQFKAIREIILEKQFELVHEANSLFEAEKQNTLGETSVLKKQIDETLKGITHAFQDENSDLMVLDKETSNYQSFESQFLKDKSSKVHNKLLSVQNELKHALVVFNKVMSSFSFVDQEVVKEIYSVPKERAQPSQEELTKRQKKLKSIKLSSCFEFKKNEGFLEINVPRPKPMEVEINQSDFKDIKTISMTIQRWTTITQEMKDQNKSLLQFLLNGLESFQILNVSLLKEALTEDNFKWLANAFLHHFQRLRQFSFRVPEGQMDDKSFQILCGDILSRTLSLQKLCIDLQCSGIRDKEIKTLASCFQPFLQKLEDFSIKLKGYYLTDLGVIELFQSIQNMRALKQLDVFLSGEFISDKSLEVFGEKVLPNLKALNSLVLQIDSSKISETGVWLIVKNLPKLKKLDLIVSFTKISDQMMGSILREVGRKVGSLEFFTFNCYYQQIKNGKIQKIEPLKKEQKVQIGTEKQKKNEKQKEIIIK